MPHPAETNWGVRCDTTYNIENRRHPLRLSDDRMVDQDVEPGISRTTDTPAVSTPPMVVMQWTGDRNLNRYKPLPSKIISQSEHTIKMSNGDMLRKSGAALKWTKTPKKRAPGAIHAPTTRQLKRKLMAN